MKKSISDNEVNGKKNKNVKKVIKREKKERKESKKKNIKKRKLNKLNIFIVIVSILFLGIGIFVILCGTGIITVSFKEKGPILYDLSEKVSIGDYVDYDAGMWEETKEIPTRTNSFTFGGYQKEMSRNEGVTCGYNGVENEGWRVFDIDEDTITLIQAGVSMCYYHGYGSGTNDKSVNILKNHDESINYNYFLNEDFGSNVTILSKEDIDKFQGEDVSYKKVDDDLIDIGIPYWLSSKNGSYYLWYVTEGGTVAVDHVGEYGVRVLVTLKKDTKTAGKNKENVWTLYKESKKEE